MLDENHDFQLPLYKHMIRIAFFTPVIGYPITVKHTAVRHPKHRYDGEGVAIPLERIVSFTVSTITCGQVSIHDLSHTSGPPGAPGLLPLMKTLLRIFHKRVIRRTQEPHLWSPLVTNHCHKSDKNLTFDYSFLSTVYTGLERVSSLDREIYQERVTQHAQYALILHANISNNVTKGIYNRMAISGNEM